MTRMGYVLGGGLDGGGFGERALLLALAKLHLPREDGRRHGDHAHHRERTDDREQCLDGPEESAARIAVAHSSASFFRIRSSVARSSVARSARTEPAASRSLLSVSSCFAIRAMCSSTTSS